MTFITERIDNITRIPPDRLRSTLPAPRAVKIEISPRCNYRCGFCALREADLRKDVRGTLCEACIAYN